VSTNFRLQEASSEDAPFIAKSIFTAFLIDLSHLPDKERDTLYEQMAEVCRRDDTLYSWRNTTVVWDGTERAGFAIAYDGSRYAEMKRTTLPLLLPFMIPYFGEGFHRMEDETEEGEYYLDTLAVNPSYRRRGIGQLLLDHCMRKASEKGIPHCTLLVDPQNEKAKSLYRKMGFHVSGEVFAFNEHYTKMTK